MRKTLCMRRICSFSLLISASSASLKNPFCLRVEFVRHVLHKPTKVHNTWMHITGAHNGSPMRKKNKQTKNKHKHKTHTHTHTHTHTDTCTTSHYLSQRFFYLLEGVAQSIYCVFHQLATRSLVSASTIPIGNFLSIHISTMSSIRIERNPGCVQLT